MFKAVNLSLVIFIFGFLFAAPLFSQTKDPLGEVNQLYASRQYEQAAAAYQNLLDKTSDIPTRAKIIYNLGKTYQQLKQFDKAIETFKQIFSMEVNDKEPGGSIMQRYRNYRSNAQWEIGNSLFAKGDYDSALNAYRMTREKYPFRSGCGTCQQGFEYRYALYEAVTLEHLGRYREAVAEYFKIYPPRLLEIYEANGQLEDLKAMIAAKDEPIIAENMKKYAWTRVKASEGLPSRRLEPFFKIYELEKAGNITALMNLARQYSKGSNSGEVGITVAKMLARHPRLTVPLVSSALKQLEGYPYLFYQILAYTRTPESVAVLKEYAGKAINSWDSMALVRALSLTGEMGEKALRELERQNLSENMKIALQMFRKGELETETYEEAKFPPIPKTKLPTDL